MSTKIITRPVLSITRIQVEADQDPLKLFFSGIKSKETRNIMKRNLKRFLVEARADLLQGDFRQGHNNLLTL